MKTTLPESHEIRVIVRVAKETEDTIRVQTSAVGLWLDRMRKGDRSWATHHAVLRTSSDNAIRLAQCLYEVIHDVRKIK